MVFKSGRGLRPVEIALTEGFAVQKAEGGLQRLAAHLFLHHQQQRSDLGGDLGRYLGAEVITAARFNISGVMV